MMFIKIMQAVEWSDFASRVHIHFDELVGTGRNWIAPARILDMDVVDFIMMLKKEYFADIYIYRGADNTVRFVGYSWLPARLAHARKFKNYLNKTAREKQITLEGFLNE